MAARKVRMRVRVHEVLDFGHTVQIVGSPTLEENGDLFAAIPSGNVTLYITNEENQPFFAQGNDYFFDISRVPAKKAAK